MRLTVATILFQCLLESIKAIPHPIEHSVCVPSWGNPEPAPVFTADDCDLSIRAMERSLPEGAYFTDRLFVGQDYDGPEVEGMVITPKIYRGRRFHIFEHSPCVLVVVNLASLTARQRSLIPGWPERQLTNIETTSWDRLAAAGQTFILECMKEKKPIAPSPGWLARTEMSSMAVMFMGKDSEILKEFRDIPVTVVEIPPEYESL